MNSYKHCPYDASILRLITDLGEQHSQCLQCGFIDYNNPKPCVAILILEGNKVLLAQRAIEPAKGMWDIPGGFIEASESAEDAVIREALEETNLHIQVTGFLGSLPDVYGDRKLPTLNLCFTAEVKYGKLKPQSDVMSLEWVSLDNLPQQMAFAHQYKILDWCRTLSEKF